MAGYAHCQAGANCRNPNEGNRPTRLLLARGRSGESGLCSYCRKAVAAGEVSETALLKEVRKAGDIENRQAVKKHDGGRVIVEADGFDPNEYESFDPDGTSVEADLPSKGFFESEGIPLDVEKEDPAQGQVAKGAVEEVAPVKRSSRKKTDADMKRSESQKKQVGGGIKAGDKREPSRVQTVKIEKPQKRSRVELAASAQIGQMREKDILEDVLQTTVKPRPVILQPVKPPKTDVLSRLGMGSLEAVDSLIDLTTTASRLVVGGTMLSVGVVLATIGSLGRLLPGGVKISKLLYSRSLRLVEWALHFTLKPISDGRFIPTAALAVSTAGIFITSAPAGALAMTPGLGSALLYAGPAALAGWAFYRVARAVVTGKSRGPDGGVLSRLGFKRFLGKRHPSLSQAYRNPEWTRKFPLPKTESDKRDPRFKIAAAEKAKLDSDFERVSAEAARQLGFKQVTLNGAAINRGQTGDGGSGDGGVDIIMRGDDGGRVVVSCKRLSTPVGSKEIRDILGAASSKEHQGSRAMVVTTIGFTRPARRFADDNGITLRTLDQLIEDAYKRSY